MKNEKKGNMKKKKKKKKGLKGSVKFLSINLILFIKMKLLILNENNIVQNNAWANLKKCLLYY